MKADKFYHHNFTEEDFKLMAQENRRVNRELDKRIEQIKKDETSIVLGKVGKLNIKIDFDTKENKGTLVFIEVLKRLWQRNK